MSGIAAIWRRSCPSSARQSLMETYVGPSVSSGALSLFNSCAKRSRKPDISAVNKIKVVDRCSAVNDVARIRRLPLSSRMDTNWLIASKSRHGALPGFLGISSFHLGYSSDTGIKPEASQNAVSNVPSMESSEVGTAGGGGSSWIEILDNARKSTIDATADAGKKIKELTDAVTPHVQQLFDTYPNLEKVVVPVGGTLCGTMMAWLVMPIILRKLHKYVSQSPIAALLGNSTKNDISYQTSLWCALEDPAKYLITFMAFSEMATLIAPSISTYLPQAWRGAFVLSFVWFLQRWKTNFIAKAMTNPDASSLDRDRISAFDKVSSLGLIGLGVMGLAEACGIAVQSILTVGGVGGVDTSFPARDVLGNILSGFSLQFSNPFSVNDYIKAGPIEGKVVEIGLTSTSLINPEKLPVIVPNSLFSSQMIVNRSRGNWRASVTKIPVPIEDIEKVPSVSEEIKVMLRSNPNVLSDSDVPYCYLSRLESSYGELTIGCKLKNMKGVRRKLGIHFTASHGHGLRLCSAGSVGTGMYMGMPQSPHMGRRGARRFGVLVARFSTVNNIKNEETHIDFLTSKSSIELKIPAKLFSDRKLLQDPSGYVNLRQLFAKNEDMCFEFTDSADSKHCFSNFALEIFRRLVIILSEKGQDSDSHFQPDSSQILVRHDSNTVKEVAVPTFLFRKGKSVYVDKIVGPFCTLVYSLCNTKLGGEYKEVLDLMVIAQKRRMTLEEILGHPLFWIPEEKYSGVMASRIFLSTGQTIFSNTLNQQAKARARVLKDFETNLSHDYYEMDFNAKLQPNGEYLATHSVPPIFGQPAVRLWEDKFTKAIPGFPASFPPLYRTTVRFCPFG